MLDVGSGSGFLLGAFYELVKDPNNINRVSVVGIEHMSELVEYAKNNLKKPG